jgi:hypothetical protein
MAIIIVEKCLVALTHLIEATINVSAGKSINKRRKISQIILSHKGIFISRTDPPIWDIGCVGNAQYYAGQTAESGKNCIVEATIRPNIRLLSDHLSSFAP